jgi:hypothetical protein
MYSLKILKFATALLITVWVSVAHATVIPYGTADINLDSGLITDRITGRIYTGLDVTDLTYADALATIGVNGMYEGWTLDYQAGVGWSSGPGINVRIYDGITPEDVQYVSDNGIWGFVFKEYDPEFLDPNNNNKFNIDDWQFGNVFSDIDVKPIFGPGSLERVYILVSRDAIDVAEPSIHTIFALALMGLAYRRLKKQS